MRDVEILQMLRELFDDSIDGIAKLHPEELEQGLIELEADGMRYGGAPLPFSADEANAAIGRAVAEAR